MNSPLSRRDLLRAGTAGAFGIAFAGSVSAIATPAHAGAATPGYGPLVDDPNGILALPAGFSYRIVAEKGRTPLASGGLTPGDPDGMGCFRIPGGFTLVNNHELSEDDPNPVPVTEGLTFDPGAPGGTTNIVVDSDGNRVRQYVSLAGTYNNCAGGVTPWHTWLTCEETEERASRQLRQDHGWVFEVDPMDETANLRPVPLKFLGRYPHEAVAVNPLNHEIYLTEDAYQPNGLYYRWQPPRGFTGGKGSLRRLALSPGGATAGRLQAMRATLNGEHVPDLSAATTPGTVYRVSWVDVPDRLATTKSVRKQLKDAQVTRGRKLEGQWFGDGGAYVVSSYARVKDGSLTDHDGQVWFYDPACETIELKTVFGVVDDYSVPNTFDGPDNITVSPYGGVVIAEDGDGLSYLVGVDENAAPYAIARSEQGGEFAGPVFSQDGRILFVSVQAPGLVLAVTGPWDSKTT